MNVTSVMAIIREPEHFVHLTAPSVAGWHASWLLNRLLNAG
jgi:hypothetical protein